MIEMKRAANRLSRWSSTLEEILVVQVEYDELK